MLLGAGGSPSASLRGTSASLECHGPGEVQNGAGLGSPFPAGESTGAMAGCEEALQLGVSHVLQSLFSVSTADETELAAEEVPPFERMKMKAVV